jgi:hypothetical protein
MQKKEIGRAVILDGVHHRAVSAVRYRIADARLFAFELIPKSAVWAAIIVRLRAGFQPAQFGNPKGI